MHRLYCPSQNISDNKIIIDNKDQVHHAKNVLRLKLNEEVVIFDDEGNEYRSILDKLLPKSMIFQVKGKEKFIPNPSKIKITVACAIPKDSRMDEIIDKLTQLGAQRIIPLETERVIVKLNKHKRILRQERWKKIALNASLQSQRNTLPVVEPIKNIKEVLSESSDYDLKLIPTLAGERENLKDILAINKAKNILIIIGPEGDFTSEEINLAKKAGFIPVSLGDLVLRVETAAIAVTSFIGLYLDCTPQDLI
ncbi:MAG: RsmE family RNA methyltransferase [Candidatus Omnitrophota bacterium]|nr:RsmE family RNA methyltransferase [Candidatus Omnitrophota bacterium]